MPDRLSRILAEFHKVVKAARAAPNARQQELIDAKQQELIDANPDLADELIKQFGALHQADSTTTKFERSEAETATYRPTAPDDTQATDEPRERSTASAKRFGDYELMDEISRGGMGIVYRAKQIGLDRIVALKMIRAGELADQIDVNRFYVEARAAAAMKHPGILPVFDVGQYDQKHYFTMELAEGGSLANRLELGLLTAKDAADLVRKVAEAVQHAHDRGIVHRDLKPGNVLIDGHGEPKVADFGLAKRTDADDGHTEMGAAIGTASYMPPEQAQGKLDEVGVAADVYSLGALLYCLLAGHPPFVGANRIEILKQVVERDPVSLRQINPSVPRDLETICHKCLRKEPTHRYSSSSELAEDLQRWLQDKPISARRVGRIEKTRLWCKRRPLVASLYVGIVVVLIVSTISLWVMQTRKHASDLVVTLLKADVEQIPSIVKDLRYYSWWSKAKLHREHDRLPFEAPEKLRTALALLALGDADQVEYLLGRLLSCKIDEFEIILDSLAPYREELDSRLWSHFRDEGDERRRFRAGLALATYASDADSWTKDDGRLLATWLVRANRGDQPQIRRQLQPVADRVLPELERLLRDHSAAESRQVVVAAAIANLAGNDTRCLARSVSASSAAQDAVLYPVLARSFDTDAESQLRELVAQQSAARLLQSERVELGRYRAGAAITLVRLGVFAAMFDALRVTDDPESLSQFVYRCRGRGITVEQLLECLRLADQMRQSRSGQQRSLDDRVIYGILLALGEFTIDEVPSERRESLSTQLIEWYGRDPNSGIHGAAGWLLRRWGFEAQAEAVDRTPVDYSTEREWFVRKIDIQVSGKTIGATRSFYLTFVVFPPGVYRLGSPGDEQGRNEVEVQQTVEITRPFAILDREIVQAEWLAAMHQGGQPPEQSDKHPQTSMPWYSAVAFCRSLTTYVGLDESEQCYLDPESLDINKYPLESAPLGGGGYRFPENWPLRVRRKGFRLPTEAEWEIACRAGTSSMFHFGNVKGLMPAYAWTLENSGERLHRVRQLRPNLRGVFDMCGNASEWCHDWWTDRNVGEIAKDPTGPAISPKVKTRVHRGGSYLLEASYNRSAERHHMNPWVGNDHFGFRLVLAADTLEELVRTLPTAAFTATRAARRHASRGQDDLATKAWDRARSLYENHLAQNPDHGPFASGLADAIIVQQLSKVIFTALKPLSVTSAGGADLTVHSDATVLVSGKNPDNETYTIVAPAPVTDITALHLETLPHPSLPRGGSGRFKKNGGFFLSEIELARSPDISGQNATPIVLKRAIAGFSRIGVSPSSAIDGNDATYWETWPRVKERNSLAVETVDTNGAKNGSRLVIRLKSISPHWKNGGIGRFRISVTNQPGGFEFMKKRFAAMRIADPWAKLGAAYALSESDRHKAAQFFEKALDRAVNRTARAVICEHASRYKDTIDELVKLHPGDSQLAAARAYVHARGGRWREAADGLAQALNLAPEGYEESCRLATLLAQLGDIEAYRRHCRSMLEHLGNPVNPRVAAQTAKACLLISGAMNDAKPVAKLIDNALAAGESHAHYRYSLFVKGLLAYRNGRFSDALALCRDSRRRDVGVKDTHLAAANLAIEAMAHHQLGNAAEATASMGEGKSVNELQLAELERGEIGSSWEEWLTAHLLYGQAEALVGAIAAEATLQLQPPGSGNRRKSASSHRQVEISFENNRKGDVHYLWVDHKGVVRPWGVIKPKSRRKLKTYARHVWLVTDGNGVTIGHFVLGGERLQHAIIK